MSNQSITKFVSLMSELFQLKEAEAIDYGIYRVIKAHNQRIADFLGIVDGDNFTPKRMSGIIDDVLSISPNAKQAALQELFTVLADSGINQEDCTMGKTTNIKQCVDKAIASNNPSVPKQKLEIDRIQEAYEAYLSLDQADERKAEIFAKLYEFYNANYEEGDFITQRSYGDGSNSVMRYTPSSGSDVEFNWATKGMYYIKSGDVFADYPVNLHNGKTLTIKMNAEQLAETRASLGVNDKAVYTYDPKNLTLDEQGNWSLVLGYVKKVKGVKESDAVLDNASDVALKTGSTEEAIKRALRRYIKRNQSDFFIHQNLKAELDTNLEFFVKNRLMVDTATLLSGTAKDIKKHLETAQAVLTIGKEINAFLGELEDFQKTLWERKKLVLSTNYVITLDKMHEYCGDDFGALLNEVLSNDKQIVEWKDLNLGDHGSVESVMIEGDLATQSRYKPLPVDTKHFDQSFKWELLNAISHNTEQGLDELLNGTLFHSDNWQALNLMQEKWREQVKCTYIDPPYNTGVDVGFSYKDGYQHSSWMTLIRDRSELEHGLISASGVRAASINDIEQPVLRMLTDSVFEPISHVTVKTKVAGVSGSHHGKSLRNAIEYLLIHCKNKDSFSFTPITYDKQELMEHIEEYEREDKSWKYTQVMISEGNSTLITSVLDGSGANIEIYSHEGFLFKSIKQVADEDYNGDIKEAYYKNINKVLRTTNAQSSVRERVIDGSKNIGSELISAVYTPRSGRNKGESTRFYYKGKSREQAAFLKDVVLVENDGVFKKISAGNLWTDFQYNNLTSEGATEFKNGKKPIALVTKFINMVVSSEDVNPIVLE